MNKILHLDPPQIVQSAQVWECTSCGSRDNKSCSCNSTAIMVKLFAKAEKLEAKKEQDRQRAKRHRASRDATVENAEEKSRTSVTFYRDPLSEPDEGVNDRWGFINRCGDAAAEATYDGPVDKEVLKAARWARDQWCALVTKLETYNQED